MQKIPQTGEKYRHYKSTGGNDYTFEIVGIAKHSENEELLVIYTPLSDGEKTRLGDAKFAVRPLNMRSEMLEYNGNLVQRFTLII